VKDGWLNRVAEKEQARQQALLEARAATVQRYLAAGSPKMKHEQHELPPRVSSSDVYEHARAAQVSAKRSGSKLGFLRANDVAREALWYAYRHPAVDETEEPQTLQLGARIDDETRACPMCAETVKVQARKCKHCGSEIEPLE
jgi:hypothetical protein